MDVLEQKQPNDEPALDPGPACVAIERRDLAIDPVTVDLATELHQLVLHVDDLLEPGAKQITFPVVFSFCGRIVLSDATIESCKAIRGDLENEIAGFRGSAPRKLVI
jgi:hypothetical protein